MAHKILRPAYWLKVEQKSSFDSELDKVFS